ncbi:MAG: glycosyltransferase family 1 protein [bacterium]|nr:glycosyltransferase family 1 protein [bacterium]
MKIAIDARAYYWTGIGRYIRNIVSEFHKNSFGHTFTLLVPEGKEEEIKKELGDDSFFSYIGVEPSYYSLKEQTRFLLQLNKLDVDLVHFTHFNVPYLYRRPYVVTIHDITRFIFPGQKRQSILQQVGYELVFANAVAHARQVIAVSNATKQDMQQLPFSCVAPITTIYEGVDAEFMKPISVASRQKVRLLLGTDRPFFLFVGVWMNHKNLIRLLAAFQEVQKHVPEVALVITGKPIPGYSNLFAYVQKDSLQRDVFFPGFVPHELLPALYAESTAFVFPSLYEGFGLPPLEAMMCGAPVIASNSSSIPELLGNSAEYVNPESVEDIARAMLKIQQDKEHSQRLKICGKQQAQQYLWTKAAEEHITVYKRALE